MTYVVKMSAALSSMLILCADGMPMCICCCIVFRHIDPILVAMLLALVESVRMCFCSLFVSYSFRHKVSDVECFLCSSYCALLLILFLNCCSSWLRC